MKTLCIALLLLLATSVRGADALAKELEPIRPFLGKTWKGHFKDSTVKSPRSITKWERALNVPDAQVVFK